MPARTKMMNQSVLVNFHCHTNFSDGELTPEALAARLAAAGVRYAALTDHDSLEGLPRFQEALKKHNIASLPGVELTTHFRGREIHLLGYGFDPHNAALAATLFSLRSTREVEVHSIAGSIRKLGTNRSGQANGGLPESLAPHGILDTADAIALLHRAGGKAFLAHPLHYERAPQKLENLLTDLQSLGLDGCEAIYAAYTAEENDLLCELAERKGLLVSAGTDFHSPNGEQPLAVAMPRAAWDRFRQALFGTANFEPTEAEAQPGPTRPPVKTRPFRRRSYVYRILFPTLIAIALFLVTIWGYLLPSFENSLLERKRELIRELTNSAVSILASYQQDVQSGLLNREEAQRMAVDRIAALRYGPEGKDYFWVQDLDATMIMHPYRPDLNGQDLSGFTDPNEVPIFVAFAEQVRAEGEGYLDYVWQWKDDPQRLEPKESYVKGFEPWGWVIGTGLYLDDVNAEITRIERSLTNVTLVVSGVVVLLLAFVLQQSLRVERERQTVLDDLQESTERYHSLVEATHEGTLLIIEGRCRYANPTFLALSGYSRQQLEFLELADLLPRSPENEPIWQQIDSPESEPAGQGAVFEGLIHQADGQHIEALLAVNPIVFAGQQGTILLARELATPAQSPDGESISHAARSLPVGIVRARAARRGTLLEMNPAARQIFAGLAGAQPSLADLFADPAEFSAFLSRLQADGEVNGLHLHVVNPDAAVRILSLTARLQPEEKNQPAVIDVLLEDVTGEHKQAREREALIERLQSALLFLHEPLAQLSSTALVCDMNTTIRQLARRMTAQETAAALIANQDGQIIGIITDHDLRSRALAEVVSLDAPAYRIMSAPVARIAESEPVYAALMRMEEKGVRHLAVETPDGRITRIVDSKTLVQFQRYAPVVLAREIARSETPARVSEQTALVPRLAETLLASSARPQHLTRMLTSIGDAAAERLIELAIQELGPPPAEFAWIAMGSQGRQEQTLLSDQDHGIIYSPQAGQSHVEIQAYFLDLGSRVSRALDQAGYAFCEGQVMASQPRWCRSLDDWQAEFSEWIRMPEPQELINLSIFFDFRAVYGQLSLAARLRENINQTLAADEAFFGHLARSALSFKPPLRLPGNIYLTGGGSEHAGEINLKDALIPFVSFARLYTLRHQLDQTNTLERIAALHEHKVITAASREEIEAAYDFLMQLRLQTQVEALQAGKPPGNSIHPARLGAIQQASLKQAFAQINAMQKKISYDFLGGTA